MRNRFDQQLHHLDEQLTHMGELCEIAISKVTQALKEGSAGQARIVVAEDEEIDQMEKEIERLCLKLPAAAGGKRFKKNFCGTENDHRYGADRGSDFRYRRDHYFCKI